MELADQKMEILELNTFPKYKMDSLSDYLLSRLLDDQSDLGGLPKDQIIKIIAGGCLADSSQLDERCVSVLHRER